MIEELLGGKVAAKKLIYLSPDKNTIRIQNKLVVLQLSFIRQINKPKLLNT
ncbi:MAG: hypothetical protein IPI59_03530 [Sphingobacteriales bacterium]|jgi:hypothetical protein|nr:hypothetical protein [Sphingobacteriales bacterium]MCC7057599.1 hypothetical protein [Chitinophagales bacterium]MDA0197494.1 hypothetical protein [Bacteroidota bacterium]MBK6890318.1 hypothetical protein [Sphingobacteriales bacterium]MBK7526627.1 hypothetical protein [Sphingobacteriales bacterium]